MPQPPTPSSTTPPPNFLGVDGLNQNLTFASTTVNKPGRPIPALLRGDSRVDGGEKGVGSGALAGAGVGKGRVKNDELGREGEREDTGGDLGCGWSVCGGEERRGEEEGSCVEGEDEERGMPGREKQERSSRSALMEFER